MSVVRYLMRLFLGRRLPVAAGDVAVPGLAGPVTVRRDRYGIPSIDAGTDRDAWFALGFCHAQDRGIQLEIYLRLGRGTLAAFVGPEALPVDRLTRRVGFRFAADRQLPVVAPDVRVTLDAYAAGINAGYERGLTKKPHEFALIGGEPSPWESADVLAMLKLQSFLLASNWDVELARLRILAADGPDALKALDPLLTDGDGQVIDPTGSAAAGYRPALVRLLDHVEALRGVVTFGGGSNNWAIAGSRTASGRPLVCNNPHLNPQLPNHWYLARIATPDWTLVGATFAGTPTVPCGHNGFAAWGVTAGLCDNTDLFLEEIKSDGGTWVYRQADTWRPCAVRAETIEIKGAKAVVEEVIATPRGPVISGALIGTPEALSLRAVWLDPRPVRGWLAVAARAELRRLPQGVGRVAGHGVERGLRRRGRGRRLATGRRRPDPQARRRPAAPAGLGRRQRLGRGDGAVRGHAARRESAGRVGGVGQQPAAAGRRRPRPRLRLARRLSVRDHRRALAGTRPVDAGTLRGRADEPDLPAVARHQAVPGRDPGRRPRIAARPGTAPGPGTAS